MGKPNFFMIKLNKYESKIMKSDSSLPIYLKTNDERLDVSEE